MLFFKKFMIIKIKKNIKNNGIKKEKMNIKLLK